MTEPSFAAQRAAVAALRADATVTALCPAGNIFDRSERPEVFPCIVLGTATTVDSSGDTFTENTVTLDIDVWTAENGFAANKTIAGAVVKALRPLDVEQDEVQVSFSEAASNFLRDPDGQHSHGALRITVIVEGDGDDA